MLNGHDETINDASTQRIPTNPCRILREHDLKELCDASRNILKEINL